MINIIKNTAGDTIVEVLIAIIILSVILSGAYVSSNDSLTNIRDAQERIQALGYAQNQAEELRAQANTVFANPVNIPFKNSGSFCFDSNSNFTAWSLPAPPVFAACQFGTIPYTVHIYGQGVAPGSPATDTAVTFKIVVNWPSISREITTAQLVIYYRVGIQ